MRNMKSVTTVKMSSLRLSLRLIGDLLHGRKQGPWSKSTTGGRSSRYERFDLDLPGPKYESSPTNHLLKGQTFKALASGGVHTGEACSSGKRDVFIRHKRACLVSESGHILMCGDCQKLQCKARLSIGVISQLYSEPFVRCQQRVSFAHELF